MEDKADLHELSLDASQDDPCIWNAEAGEPANAAGSIRGAKSEGGKANEKERKRFERIYSGPFHTRLTLKNAASLISARALLSWRQLTCHH